MKGLKILNQVGLSLVEVLIAMLLTCVIGGFSLKFYMTQHDNWLVQEDISEMQQNARVALDEISTNIRKAGYGLPASHPTISVATDTIKMFYKDSVKIDTLVYYVSRQDSLHPTLMRRLNNGAAQVFAENIESLQFQKANKLVTVQIVAREQRKDSHFVGDKYRRRVLTSRVEVRNRA
jgi:uncharacterized protein YxeA